MSQEFDEQLRERLRRAAAGAPAYRPRQDEVERIPRRGPGRRTTGWLVAAAIVAAVAAATPAIMQTEPTPEPPPAAATRPAGPADSSGATSSPGDTVPPAICAATVRFGDRTYVAREVAPARSRGRELGQGLVLPCVDTPAATASPAPVRVHALAGVTPDVAIWVDGARFDTTRRR